MPQTVRLEALPEAAVQIDAHGRFVAGNRLAAMMFGSPRPNPGPVIDAIVAVDGFRQWLAAESQAVFRTRLRAWRHNGVPLTIELAARHLGPGHGALCLLIELDRERIAYEARRYFDAAFDAAPIGMGLFNTDGQYARVNAALCRLLGRSEAELLGRRDQQFTHPDDRQADVDAAWRILQGELDTWQCEKRFVRPDGSIVWAIANLTFLRDADGNPISWLGQFQDITERKQLEVDLRARERRTRQILEAARPGHPEEPLRDDGRVDQG